MLIRDPSRVFVGNKGEYDGSGGTTVDKIAERYGAIAGINGGGFYDLNGQGNGGLPDGFVISEGELCYEDDGTPHAAIGFTQDNKMVIGFYSYYDAHSMCLWLEKCGILFKKSNKSIVNTTFRRKYLVSCRKSYTFAAS